MLSIAVKAARRAANVIIRGSLDMEMNKVEVTRKSSNDYVTSVDFAAEQAIIEVLQEAYPDHAILSEETGLIGDEHAEYQWIVDPLDGTRNFVHNIPDYVVSIAVLKNGVAQHAVVFDPIRNEMFTASRGSGTFLNDRRVRVSSCRSLQEGILVGRLPIFSKADQTVRTEFLTLMKSMAAYRQFGSSILELAYIAAGRIDALCNYNLRPWDLAAGVLLIQEAGGLVGDYKGEQSWQEKQEIIAGNPRVFAKMVQVLNTEA